MLDACSVQQVPGLLGVVAFSGNCQIISRNSLYTRIHPAFCLDKGSVIAAVILEYMS